MKQKLRLWKAKIISKLWIRIADGQQVPKWYGIAYIDYYDWSAVAMPIPLNIIVGAYKATIAWVMCPDNLFRNERVAYITGRKDERKRWEGKVPRTRLCPHCGVEQ